MIGAEQNKMTPDDDSLDETSSFAQTRKHRDQENEDASSLAALEDQESSSEEEEEEGEESSSEVGSIVDDEELLEEDADMEMYEEEEVYTEEEVLTTDDDLDFIDDEDSHHVFENSDDDSEDDFGNRRSHKGRHKTKSAAKASTNHVDDAGPLNGLNNHNSSPVSHHANTTTESDNENQFVQDSEDESFIEVQEDEESSVENLEQESVDEDEVSFDDNEAGEGKALTVSVHDVEQDSRHETATPPPPEVSPEEEEAAVQAFFDQDDGESVDVLSVVTSHDKVEEVAPAAPPSLYQDEEDQEPEQETHDYEVKRSLTAGADDLVYSPKRHQRKLGNGLKEKMAAFGGSDPEMVHRPNSPHHTHKPIATTQTEEKKEEIAAVAVAETGETQERQSAGGSKRVPNKDQIAQANSTTAAVEDATADEYEHDAGPNYAEAEDQVSYSPRRLKPNNNLKARMAAFEAANSPNKEESVYLSSPRKLRSPKAVAPTNSPKHDPSESSELPQTSQTKEIGAEKVSYASPPSSPPAKLLPVDERHSQSQSSGSNERAIPADTSKEPVHVPRNDKSSMSSWNALKAKMAVFDDPVKQKPEKKVAASQSDPNDDTGTKMTASEEPILYSPKRRARASSDAFKARMAAFTGGAALTQAEPKKRNSGRPKMRRINSEGTMETVESKKRREKPKQRVKRRNSYTSSSENDDEYQHDAEKMEESLLGVDPGSGHPGNKDDPVLPREPDKKSQGKASKNDPIRPGSGHTMATTDTYPSFFGDESTAKSKKASPTKQVSSTRNKAPAVKPSAGVKSPHPNKSKQQKNSSLNGSEHTTDTYPSFFGDEPSVAKAGPTKNAGVVASSPRNKANKVSAIKPAIATKPSHPNPTKQQKKKAVLPVSEHTTDTYPSFFGDEASTTQNKKATVPKTTGAVTGSPRNKVSAIKSSSAAKPVYSNPPKQQQQQKKAVIPGSEHTTDTYPSFFGDEATTAGNKKHQTATKSGIPAGNEKKAVAESTKKPMAVPSSPTPKVQSSNTDDCKVVHSQQVDPKAKDNDGSIAEGIVADESPKDAKVLEPAVIAKEQKKMRRRKSYSSGDEDDGERGGHDTEDEYEQSGGYRGTFMDWGAQQRAISRRRKKIDTNAGGAVNSARNVFEKKPDEEQQIPHSPRRVGKVKAESKVPVEGSAPVAHASMSPFKLPRALGGKVTSARDLFDNKPALHLPQSPRRTHPQPKKTRGKKGNSHGNEKLGASSHHSYSSSDSNFSFPDLEEAPKYKNNLVDQGEAPPVEEPSGASGGNNNSAPEDATTKEVKIAKDVKSRRRRNSFSGASSGDESEDGGNTTEDEYRVSGGFRGTFMDFDAQQRAISRKRDTKRRGAKKSGISAKANMFDKKADTIEAPGGTLTRSPVEAEKKIKDTTNVALGKNVDDALDLKISTHGTASRGSSRRSSMSDVNMSASEEDEPWNESSRRGRTVKRSNSIGSAQDDMYHRPKESSNNGNDEDEDDTNNNNNTSEDDYGGRGYRGCLLDFNAQQRAISRKRQQSPTKKNESRSIQERLAVFQK